MATYTQNLDLKKPAQSDKIRIADINNNMDTIDGVVGDVGERSIAAQIGDVEGALAIVSTGNVHGAITSGQYVYIKNHDTLDDGLYVATTNISANGTLSSSNVTADSAGGGLNALNGKMSNNLNVDKMRFVVARNSDRFSFDVGSSDGATAFVFNGNQGVCAYFALTFGASPAVDTKNISGTTTWTISQSGSTVTLVRSDGTMWGMACLIVALH